MRNDSTAALPPAAAGGSDATSSGAESVRSGAPAPSVLSAAVGVGDDSARRGSELRIARRGGVLLVPSRCSLGGVLPVPSRLGLGGVMLVPATRLSDLRSSSIAALRRSSFLPPSSRRVGVFCRRLDERGTDSPLGPSGDRTGDFLDS